MFSPSLISAALAAVYAKAASLIENTNDRDLQRHITSEAVRVTNQILETEKTNDLTPQESVSK
jgi:hypothetical protein